MAIRDSKTNSYIVGNSHLDSLKKIGSKISRFIIGSTIPKVMFRVYFLIIILGAILLCCPCSLQKIDGVQLDGFKSKNFNFLQALFIACSGFSNTGLTPVVIFKYFNWFGQFILLIIIEIGGMGAFALSFWVWCLIKKIFKKIEKKNIKILQILQSERGGNCLSDSFRVISIAFTFLFCIQIIFAFIYSFCFCFIPAYQQKGIDENNGNYISYNDYSQPLKSFGNYGYSLWVALFSSVSVVNNAGFDIISKSSLSPYRNDLGTILQFFIMIELIIGGLGHFIIFEFVEKIRYKRKGLSYRLSLFTKLSLFMYIFVALIGLVFSFCFELSIKSDPKSIIGFECKNFEFGKNVMYNKCFCIFYNVVECRSLGMNTIDCRTLSEWSKWVFNISMLIGGAPSSTAGGIRVTTIALIFVTIWNKLCGRKEIIFFNHTINKDLAIEAFMILVISIILVFFGTIIFWSSLPSDSTLSIQKKYTFTDVFFESASAFGTVGISMSYTAIAKWWGLLTLTVLMFIGQLGITNTLLSWTKDKPKYDNVIFSYESIKLQ